MEKLLKEEQEMLAMLENNSLEDIVENMTEEERFKVLCEEADRKAKAEENTVYILDGIDREKFGTTPKDSNYPYLDKDGFIVEP